MKQSEKKPATRMPVVFAGHGSPTNAADENRWSRGFAQLGEIVRRPSAVLAISAHWYVRGTYLTANPKPKTIHDFSGFPAPLYEIQYPAPGSPDLATRVTTLLARHGADLRSDWGLDHGTWSVLRWMFPAADVPVVQLSIHRDLAPAQHLELARSLLGLRDEGVLIVGSGNITHNLRDAFTRMRSQDAETPPWATSFDQLVATALEQRDTRTLLSMWPGDDEARLAHPTPDHWLPLLYAYAATDDDDVVRFPTTGFDLGSISMRNVVFG